MRASCGFSLALRLTGAKFKENQITLENIKR